MSDLVRTDANSGKVSNPSGRGTRGRGKKDAKTVNEQPSVTIEVAPVAPEAVDTVADKTLSDAVVTMADTELKSAIDAYNQRTDQNLGILAQFVKQKQASVANAITRHAFDTFGVTEEELYGDAAVD